MRFTATEELSGVPKIGHCKCAGGWGGGREMPRRNKSFNALMSPNTYYNTSFSSLVVVVVVVVIVEAT